MEEIQLKDIHRLCRQSSISWTSHAGGRLIKRQISPDEVIHTLRTGTIIEQYPTDYPFPSCLIVATVNSRPLHVVCSIGNNQLYIITAYQPDPDAWDSTFTIRRKDDEPS